MDLDAFVQTVRAEMERQFLTQSELARLAGISRQRVNRILTGTSRSIPTLRAIKAVLWPKEPHAKT